MSTDDNDDGWSGDAKKPWLNPPSRGKTFGAGRGAWRYAMMLIVAAVAVVIVILLLVDADRLPRAWAYAALPIAIVAAAASRVLTIFKAGAEDKVD
jgi:hypothetical protein